MSRAQGTPFEAAVDIPAWLEADRRVPLAERLQRDRGIARGIDLSGDPARAVRQWWRMLPPPPAPGTGARLQHIRRLVGLGMVVIGAIAGTGVALAAFHYDGTHPVNVMRVLALLVALPLLLLVPTLLLAIPGGPLRRLQQSLSALNAGSFAWSLARRLAGDSPGARHLLDAGVARAGAAGRFARWQMLCWSQLAGTAFALAALATAILLVTFTDLAFGWSTTLGVGPEPVSRLVAALSWPWRELAPGAVPSPALVEASQYFRLDGNRMPGTSSSRMLTDWWPFTLLAIATYALLPRLLLLVMARLRLAAATRALLLEDAQVTALLDRMRQPDIQTAGTGPGDRAMDPATAAQPAPARGTRSARAVVWNDCLAAGDAVAQARRLDMEIDGAVAAGGSRTLAEDRQALGRFDARDTRPVLVFTPAWEPPLLEFLDYLGELRRQVGSQTSIIVAPVGEDGAMASDAEIGVWSQAMGRAHDAHLYVEAGHLEAGHRT